MIYRHVVADFAERTLSNLEQIKALASVEAATGRPSGELSAFPTTQLVTSFLGLIVFPKEKYEDHIPDISIQRLVDELGWPPLHVDYPKPECKSGKSHETCTTLRELTRVLRNGVSHFNVDFINATGEEEIQSIRLANRCPRCKQETAAIVLGVKEMEEIAYRYAALIVREAAEKEGYAPRRPSLLSAGPNNALQGSRNSGVAAVAAPERGR